MAISKIFLPVTWSPPHSSPSGISTSVGVGPLRLSTGPRSSVFTAAVPGTGLSFRQSLTPAAEPQAVISLEVPSRPMLPPPVPDPASPGPGLEPIQSAGSSALTTPGLAEFRHLLEQSRREQSAISRELVSVRAQETITTRKHLKWENGWLLRRIFKAKFQAIQAASQESSSHRTELEEQEQLSRLQTQLELPPRVAEAFHRLSDDFAAMSKAGRLWDTVGQRATNRVVERTTAARTIDRKTVSFRLGRCDLIESEWNVPHLENANGGDIYFYPAFVLYFVSSESFALLEYKEVNVAFKMTTFIEEEAVPPDAR